MIEWKRVWWTVKPLVESLAFVGALSAWMGVMFRWPELGGLAAIAITVWVATALAVNEIKDRWDLWRDDDL